MKVASTFQSYLSSFELTDRKRGDASDQQVALRDRLRLHLAGFVDSRLVGSYRRGTAIRPLKDIDVFVVLDARQHHRDVPEAPLRLLQTIERALRVSYPSHQPRIQGRSVNIGFSGLQRSPELTHLCSSELTHAAVPDRDRDLRKEGLGSVAVRDTTVTARHRDALAPDRLFV